MKITINNKTYEVIKNEKDAIDEEVLKEAITEYFENFDFIVGDWAYGKLRLKGFNDKSNKNFKPINDIKNVTILLPKESLKSNNSLSVLDLKYNLPSSL